MRIPSSKVPFSAAVIVVAMSLLAVPAQAEIGAIDVVPAATLLLPYFEVDLDLSDGYDVNTLFSLGNASADPTLAHVTFWTDYSRPTLDFDLYLTGYDIITVNLGWVFNEGVVPSTAPGLDQSAGGQVDENGGVPGAFSNPDLLLPASCIGVLPLPTMPAGLVAYIQELHVGNAAPPGFTTTGLYAGSVVGDQTIARGYITIDAVNECSQIFPATTGYFLDGGNGIASNANVLWGDWYLIDFPGNYAVGEPLVHIEAMDSVGNGFWGPNLDYTFYGRYLAGTGFEMEDNREPLGTTWGARYFSGDVAAGGFDTPTRLICWRGTGQANTSFFPVQDSPGAPFPLNQTELVIFDEFENPVQVEGSPFSPPGIIGLILACPKETQATSVGIFPDLFDFGWIYLNLQTTTGSPFDPVTQSYVAEIHTASGMFSVGYQALQFDSALNKTFQVTTSSTTGTVGP